MSALSWSLAPPLARTLVAVVALSSGLWAGALARGPGSAQALEWALLATGVAVALLQQTLP